jgi:hypothetical protein
MPNVTFTTPNADDIDELVAHMRQQDVDEVLATGQTDLRAAVADGVNTSALVWTARIDGEVAAIFGVAPFGQSLMAPTGIPWMLGTDLVPRHRRILVRHTAAYIQRMLALYPRLTNAVHAKNTVAVRWLQRAGFTLGEPFPAEPTGEMFHPFEMVR